MKVALIGASGRVGSRLVEELSRRKHEVTGIARDAARIAKLPGVTPTSVDIADAGALTATLEGLDAVISSVPFGSYDPGRLIAAVKASGAKRYLVVGEAGSLEWAPDVRYVDTPHFPVGFREEAKKGADFLERLRQEPDLDWTYLSPSGTLVAGTRTGWFRIARDGLLWNENGGSISFEDYAFALVNEMEAPKHSRKRFTVGY